MVNANSSLSGIGVTASSSGAVVSIESTSPNLTTYTQSVSSGGTETLTLDPTTGVMQDGQTCRLSEPQFAPNPGANPYGQSSTMTIGGTPKAGDVLAVTVYESRLPGGSESVSYTVQSTDTTSSIASQFQTILNNNQVLNAHFYCYAYNQVANVVYLVDYASTTAPSVEAYSASVLGSATETVALNYPGSGNHSDFTYDAYGRNVKILEYTGGSLASTK